MHTTVQDSIERNFPATHTDVKPYQGIALYKLPLVDLNATTNHSDMSQYAETLHSFVQKQVWYWCGWHVHGSWMPAMLRTLGQREQ